MISTVRLIVSWATVAAVTLAPTINPNGLGPALSGLLFAVLLGVIVWAAFGVVHEAEELAQALGEPLGTLVLTLSIVVIEVALISAVMLGSANVPTLGRDTMFAVLMIVLNGVVGLGLLVGGLRHHQQSFNLQGASAYLSVTIPLAFIALVLPNFTTSTSIGTVSPVQAGLFSALTITLYGLFLWLQTGRYQGFFQPSLDHKETPDARPLPHTPSEKPISVGRHTFLLIANVLPIVILSKGLAKLLDAGIDQLGAPTALGGIIIAMVVFTPESISALKAVADNQLTRAVNLCLGAAASTLGLTVPAVLLIGLLTGQPVVLGLSSANMVLLAVTLILNTLTFSGRTTMLEGTVHLTLFGVFLVLVFSP